MAVIVITIVCGQILVRLVTVLLESILHQRHFRHLLKLQIAVSAILFILEAVVLFVSTMLQDDRGMSLSCSIILFLFFEFVLYEAISHIFQVRLSRSLVREPSKLSKMSRISKWFLNPIVYEHINSSS
mmetsp:Transcript_42745/g.50088  ORF Transcript_42745/g.50088 Transcript_42745/m.50088 type:complete len:128 (-) Transcript_42745:40-423(-)